MTTPVTIVTGFLGSGKTTLLAALLRRPELARTAVIVNEFGDVGLDHLLVEASEESVVQLETGCLCCAVRGDLVRTIDDLLARRDAGVLPPFDRIVVETSGLADPAPILHGLIADRDLAGRTTLDAVVTTVDALHGLGTLDRHPESVKQAAVADRLVITKTDLAAADDLEPALRRLNPHATLLTARHGAVDPAVLLGAGGRRAGTVQNGHAHTHGIATFTLIRTAPVSAVAFALFLETLAENCGADLLRVKGLVHVAESPERPMLVHGVQHVFHPPDWLDRWPDDDRRTRLVFIVRDIPQDWVEALLDLLDAEVRATTERLQKEESACSIS